MNRQLYLLTSHKNGWAIVEADVPPLRHNSPNGRVNISLGDIMAVDEYLNFNDHSFSQVGKVYYYLEDDVTKINSIEEGKEEIIKSLFTDFNLEWWEK